VFYDKNLLNVTIIALKKKPKATKCSDRSTVSLIAHTAKILRRRIEMKIENVLFFLIEGARSLEGLLCNPMRKIRFFLLFYFNGAPVE
jgi:hypothetical protein